MSHSSFHAFSAEHALTLAIGFFVLTALLIYARRSEASSNFIRVLLAVTNLLSYPLALYAWKDHSKSLDNVLPFHLCDLAAFVAGFALLTRKPILLALTYFWGLAATTQALITPAISIGPPDFAFIHFFIQHFAITTTALFIPIVMKWRLPSPWWKTSFIVFGISVAYQGLSLLINLSLKTNFAFTRNPPDNPSVIDHLGPWPIYLFSMQGIALVFYLLLALFVRPSRDDKNS